MSSNATHQIVQQFSLRVELVDEPRKAERSLSSEVDQGIELLVERTLQEDHPRVSDWYPCYVVRSSPRLLGRMKLTHLHDQMFDGPWKLPQSRKRLLVLDITTYSILPALRPSLTSMTTETIGFISQLTCNPTRRYTVVVPGS